MLVKKKEQRLPEIPAASLADIAFMLLIFFLAATTIESGLGISKHLPPLHTTSKNEVTTSGKNIINLAIDEKLGITLNGAPITEVSLRMQLKAMLLNAQNLPNWPTRLQTMLPILGPVKVTQALCVFSCGDAVSYGAYIHLQDIVMQVFTELRNTLALQLFNQPYAALTLNQQRVIRMAVPYRMVEL